MSRGACRGVEYDAHACVPDVGGAALEQRFEVSTARERNIASAKPLADGDGTVGIVLAGSTCAHISHDESSKFIIAWC